MLALINYKPSTVCLTLQAESCQTLLRSLSDSLPPPPDRGVQDWVGGEGLLAGLPQVPGTVLPVVLELAQGGLHWVGDADPAQAGQGEMVVEEEDLVRIEEALDVETVLGVVGTSVDVLHYMKV